MTRAELLEIISNQSRGLITAQELIERLERRLEVIENQLHYLHQLTVPGYSTQAQYLVKQALTKEYHRMPGRQRRDNKQ